MCSEPEEKDGMIFACRRCNDCISTRRNDWVARAMMEKAYHKNAVCLTLTYNDENQRNRDGARAFQYIDVREWLSRVRASLRRKDASGEVRFLCAGEQGERFRRCHWHVILYTALDVSELGEWFGKIGSHSEPQQLNYKSQIYSGTGKTKRRVRWSLWPHGFVCVQEPDQGAMSYVLTYCLKDQFTHEKSKGTMREGKVENFATGLFRMSKRPAIGERWLFDKLARLDSLGAVLPDLDIKVPGLRGYYHPSGMFRKKVLWALVALNKRAVWATGQNAPQWSGLLNKLKDSETDMGILQYDQENKETETEFASRVHRQGAEYSRSSRVAQTIRKCGGAIPCVDCLNGLSTEKIQALGLERHLVYTWCETGSWQYSAKAGTPSYDERRRHKPGGCNPLCLLRGSKDHREAFGPN